MIFTFITQIICFRSTNLNQKELKEIKLNSNLEEHSDGGWN